VYHFAAAVGVGQSMYELAAYAGTNTYGTAVLLQALLERPVARLIVASSMSVYGEGRYRTAAGGLVPGRERTVEQLRAGVWDMLDDCGRPLEPVPTSEDTPPALSSVYALSKFDQERLCLLVGRAYGIPAVALRFFNIYGPRQALSNPYTGVLAIFASRLLNGKRPAVFEDGLQQRDFVHVSDVVRACRLALHAEAAAGRAINVGSGRASTVREIAERLDAALGTGIEPEVLGKYRAGDIRHCVADIRLAREVLGYEPRVPLEDGLVALAGWLADQTAEDRVDEASAALDVRGLTV
jgi:dTDP-L-rhamnose 4-epimerase